MKIKIFRNPSEEEVNEWLKQKIEVLQMSSSYSNETDRMDSTDEFYLTFLYQWKQKNEQKKVN